MTKFLLSITSGSICKIRIVDSYRAHPPFITIQMTSLARIVLQTSDSTQHLVRDLHQFRKVNAYS